MGSLDPQLKRPTTVASIPAALSDVASGSLSLNAGTAGSFNITNIADNETLSLWNILYTVYIDVQNSLDHVWPTGSTFTGSNLKNFVIADHLDWANSSDTTNVRYHVIYVQNADSAPHTFYLSYKAYTVAAVAGR